MISYDYELKKRMNKKNFFVKKKTDEKMIDKIKEKRITKLIINLNSDIQKKIYIYAMKHYWRDNFMDTPLLSLTDKYNIYLNKELSKTILNNVHFLHLEFNCKPGYKSYISGCQCDFCIDYPKEEKDQEYINIMDNKDPYFDCDEVSYEYSETILPKNWFDPDTTMVGSPPAFDFMKGSYEDIIKSDPCDSPQYFSYELQN